MKSLSVILYLLILSTVANAKNYYISFTGNDANDGLTILTPWKTIAKLHNFTFAANDSILFKRGDTFYGGIIINRSNLNFDAYGTGSKPIITGLSTVSGWVGLGGNLYEAPVTGVSADVNLVLRDGKIQQVGRYPNAATANGGYLTYTSGNITALNGVVNSNITNWTGAEIVIRPNRWSIYKSTVLSHSGTTINFAPITDVPRANFGYFFQRDSRTLDIDGEWWYDAVNSKLRVYSTVNPSTYNYQIATVDILIKNNVYYSNISIKNLSFNGSGRKTIWMNSGRNHIVQNCDVINSGINGIELNYSFNVWVDNCKVKNTLGTAIKMMQNDPFPIMSKITNCTVDSTAMIAGMENTDNYNGSNGIINKANKAIVQNCSVTNSGYVAIEWQGSDVVIKYNYVNKFCSVRDDGAGIYTYQGRQGSLPYYYNRMFIGNIILNGIGANNGTDDLKGTSVNGIYFDEGTHNVIIDSNTIAFVPGAGIFGNSNDSLTIRNNTSFNNGFSHGLNRLPKSSLVRNIVCIKNIFYPYRFGYRNIAIDNPTLITKEADISAMGNLDSNYYSLKSGKDTSLYAVTTNANLSNYTQNAYNFAYLTTTLGIETHSTNVVNTGTLEYNASNTPKVILFVGFSKKDIFGNIFNDSVTIPSWNSKVLIANGSNNSNKAPLANGGIDKILTLPTDSTILTGTGTDLDGTIISYAWVNISGPSTGIVVSTNFATTAIINLVQGVYQFELTVKDNLGAIGKDTVQVTLNPPVNQILKADAGSDILLFLPINSTKLKGSATGIITSYTWTKILGPEQFTIVTPNSPATQINNLVIGNYIFQFKVIDSAGISALANINITVVGILPVKLINFTTKNSNDKIVLQWEVSSEINVSHYAIERSDDGHNFANIGQLNANNLLDIQINYNFNDNLPFEGINYYRLVMIDKNGMFTYSKTISVLVNNAPSFTLNTISISLVNTNIKMVINSNYNLIMNIIIGDISGRIIFTNSIQLQKGYNVIEKKIHSLNTGMYYAKLFSRNQIVTKALLSGD